MNNFKGFGISPSILSADFANLSRDIKAAEEGGAVCIHVDVMDGHFVPNLTIGAPVVRSIRKTSAVPLDVHLMIENPEQYIRDFADAGSNLIAVHTEASPHLNRTLSTIRECGALAGAALNPSTPLVILEEIVPYIDFVLIMSVNPGFSGQKFIPESIAKVEKTRSLLDSKRANKVFIEVDGGVDMTNIRKLKRAGASLFVAGSAVYGNADPSSAVRNLLSEINTP